MRYVLFALVLTFSLSGHTDFVEPSPKPSQVPLLSQVPVFTDRSVPRETIRTFKGQQIRIGIIDTGYDASLATTKIKLCKTGHFNFLTGKAEIASTNPHGTVVASIIAEELQDVNYCAVIYQTVGRRGLNTNTIKQAFQLAKSEGLAAINLSLGGRQYSFHERRAIKQAADRGTVIFAAAGNEKINLDAFCNSFPACYPIANMYVVGATERDNSIPAAYSNYGQRIQIWMPGDYAFNGEIVEGTSFAAPRALADYVYSLYLVQVGQ